jgi:hypothetical protein
MLNLSSRTLPTDTMVFEWARAETKRLVDFNWIAQPLADRADASPELSHDDGRALVDAIRGHRGAFFGIFVTNPTNWLDASCSVETVGRLNLCKYFDGTHQVNGVASYFRTIEELAEGDPSFRLPQPFVWSTMRGRPVLVSYSAGGPWLVMEGTHRLVEIYHAAKEGKAEKTAVDVIAGVNPIARNWNAWRDPPAAE